MNITIYHNPRCSKSRKTLEIIENAGITPKIVKYLDDPPPAARILELARAIGIPVADLLRRGEDVFKNAGDLPPIDDDGAVAQWIERNPIVLQRPIVVDDATGAAVIGRPPENVNAILST